MELEKLCFTQCDWLRLFMTFDTGMNITNFWKLFHYEVKRYNNEELIGIRDLLDEFLRIASIIL